MLIDIKEDDPLPQINVTFVFPTPKNLNEASIITTKSIDIMKKMCRFVLIGPDSGKASLYIKTQLKD